MPLSAYLWCEELARGRFREESFSCRLTYFHHRNQLTRYFELEPVIGPNTFLTHARCHVVIGNSKARPVVELPFVAQALPTNFRDLFTGDFFAKER